MTHLKFLRSTIYEVIGFELTNYQSDSFSKSQFSKWPIFEVKSNFSSIFGVSFSEIRILKSKILNEVIFDVKIGRECFELPPGFRSKLFRVVSSWNTYYSLYVFWPYAKLFRKQIWSLMKTNFLLVLRLYENRFGNRQMQDIFLIFLNPLLELVFNSKARNVEIRR